MIMPRRRHLSPAGSDQYRRARVRCLRLARGSAASCDDHVRRLDHRGDLAAFRQAELAGLRQLARITRPGGLLILFHPSGRAALAARHGRILEPDEPLAEAPLQRLTQSTGWRLTTYDDAECRFLAIAARE